MDEKFFQRLEYAHDVVCPKCGCKASYTYTGGYSFKSACCHQELEDLVRARLDNFPDNRHVDNSF